MTGTLKGGKLAAIKNRQRHGEDFYKRIGSKGGAKTYESGKLYQIGFGGDRERARAAGSKGGKISRRKAKEAKNGL